jgi:hypothetical protein
MTGSLRITPDGRIITDADHAAAPTRFGGDPRLQALQPFIDACLTVLPDGPLAGNVRLGVFLFLLGAADRLWQRLSLDEQRFPAFAEALLELHGLSAEEAATLALTLPQIRDNEAAREVLLEGAETLDHWLDGHDSNSVLRLNELVLHWRQMPGAFTWTAQG